MEHHISKGMLRYRRHVGRGHVMKPATFKKIEKSAMKRYHISKTRAAKVAGAAYYRTLSSKFHARHRA